MSIVNKIERIQNAKTSIKTAIENKGVEVGDGTIDTYASKIDEISTGSVNVQTDNFVSTYASAVHFDSTVFPENTELDLKFQKLSTLEKFLQNCVNVVKAKVKANVQGTKASLLHFAYYNPLMTEIDISGIDCNGKGFTAVNMASMFTTCRVLKRIIGEINFSDALYTTNIFTNCSALEEVRFTANSLSISLDMKNSNLLTDESIESVINSLKDLTGSTAQILTLHADVKAKIEANPTLLASITSKNWTLA